ncbi:hypothetical protein [Persicitalea jodogahamensis]|uniref:Type 1 periplasmic binding fold superfamily protein n=1 Tax=Persicitalea jodogahamensis TaxID=402147 RepID=A0A8J3G7F1_9BACT|nr:hypothetical protein [Persicitalea jodogahamensis]GHB55618.1 hypothetical protein GCM10007390_06040 [Persicitalea jodogahamensis]
MKRTNQNWNYGLIIGVAFLFMQCKSASDVTPDDENELITTVQLNFTPENTGFPTVQTFTYRDVDGDGGNAPTKFDTVSLQANTNYTLKITLLDESKNPAVDITQEVKEKSDEHLVVFTASPASLFKYTYGDTDASNLPLGLTGMVLTGTAGTGKLKVQLRHQPPISGKVQKDGTPGPGSDDVNLDFVLMVK